MSRTVDIDGISNARDLGGLPRQAGGLTPPHVFIRSDQPDLLDERGWRLLHSRGVSAVVDLRQPIERDAARVAVPRGIADLHVDHDGLEQEPAFWSEYWDSGLVGTPLYYLAHITTLTERTTAVLAAIAGAPPGTVLFHCAAGKDRTGIVSTVLLLAAGVETEAIVTDYLESVANGERLARRRGRRNEEPVIAELLAARGTTVEAEYRQFLAGVDLDRILAGLSREDARRIRTWRGALEA